MGFENIQLKEFENPALGFHRYGMDSNMGSSLQISHLCEWQS